MIALAHAQARFLADVAARRTPGHAAYARSIAAARRDALRAAYPVVERLVGGTFFDALADRYTAAHPSTSGDLHRHGDALAPFIAGDAHCAGLPYLADVARLEWALHRAALADDERALDVALLARVAPEAAATLRPRLHGSVALLESPYDVVALWEANQPARDGSVRDVERPCRVVAWRDAQLAARMRETTAVEWSLLTRCQEGTTLGALLEASGGEEFLRRIPALAAEGIVSRCD